MHQRNVLSEDGCTITRGDKTRARHEISRDRSKSSHTGMLALHQRTVARKADAIQIESVDRTREPKLNPKQIRHRADHCSVPSAVFVQWPTSFITIRS